MNKEWTTDFFPEPSEKYAALIAPAIFTFYQDSAEDRRHEEKVQAIEAQLNEKLGIVFGDQLGELPFDAEADRKRWEKLEKDFDRLFEEAQHRAV